MQICLIVEKYSQTRRWHFDTILKVLILADQSVKEDSAKSLVHLITITPELQQYCLAKLFFSASQNLRNDTLCKVTMYLIGELSSALLRVREVEIRENNIIDLIEQILFRPGAADETIEYGLSALFKLHDKFGGELRERIVKMIKSFESHSDLEVQKRACEYVKLLDQSWREERVKEICTPIPPMRAAANTFGSIPIGETTMDLETDSLKMPEKLNVNYDEQSPTRVGEQREFRAGDSQQNRIVQDPVPNIISNTQPQTQNKKVKSLLDDDDEAPVVVQTQITQPVFQQPPKPPQQNSTDPFDILGLDIGGSTPAVTKPQTGGDIFGFSFGQSSQPQPVFQPTPVVTPVANQNKGFNSLLDDGFLGGGSSVPQPTPVLSQPQVQPSSLGFDFLGTGATTTTTTTFNNQPTQPSLFTQPAQQTNNTFKFKAYESPHVEVWMECRKDGDGSTRVTASFMNKTHSYIEQLSLQTAVMKYLKIAIQPMSGTSLPPNSKGAVTQVMSVTNSALGEKPIVMKIKLSYFINGEKAAYEEKIEGFPNGF